MKNRLQFCRQAQLNRPRVVPRNHEAQIQFLLWFNGLDHKNGVDLDSFNHRTNEFLRNLFGFRRGLSQPYAAGLAATSNENLRLYDNWLSKLLSGRSYL